MPFDNSITNDGYLLLYSSRQTLESDFSAFVWLVIGILLTLWWRSISFLGLDIFIHFFVRMFFSLTLFAFFSMFFYVLLISIFHAFFFILFQSFSSFQSCWFQSSFGAVLWFVRLYKYVWRLRYDRMTLKLSRGFLIWNSS